MSGLIITLRKNSFRHLEELSNEVVLLGHYDQLEVRESFNFSDFYFSTLAKEDKNREIREFGPASYGETQQVYLVRLPKRDDYEDLDMKDLGIEEDIESLQKLKHESGRPIPYDIDIKNDRKCYICDDNRNFTPKYFVTSLITLNEFADSFYSRLRARRYLFEILECHIKKYVVNNKPCSHMDFEIFSLLGSGDIGILWYTRDITLPAKCLQYLKKVVFSDHRIPIISSTYSVMALIPDINGEDTTICDKEDVYADIHLNYKSGADQEGVLYQLYQKLKLQEDHEFHECLKEKVFIRYGSYDTTVRISAKKIPLSLYSLRKNDSAAAEEEKEFCLDYRSKFFRDNCLQVYTRLIFSDDVGNSGNEQIDLEDSLEDSQYIKLQYSSEDFNNDVIKSYEKQEYEDIVKYKNEILSKLLKETQELIDNKEKKYKIFLRAPHLKESINQTFQGLTRIVIGQHNNAWSDDLCDQYEAVIYSIKHLVELDEIRKYGTSQETYDFIVRLLRALHQTYAHIEQGSRPYFDAPVSGLSYAGSHERTIGAYYGIVKLFIEIIYTMKRNNNQKKLIPILRFSDNPLIQSTAYPCEIEKEDCLLILFLLPYSALYNIPKYIRFLAHELYHYCSISDRYSRNRILGVYMIARMLSQFMFFAIASSESKTESQTMEEWMDSDQGKTTETCCLNIAFYVVNNNYEDILFSNSYPKSVDTNDKEQIHYDSPWSAYFLYLASIFYKNSREIIKSLYLYGTLPNTDGIFRLFCDKLEDILKKIDNLLNYSEVDKKIMDTAKVTQAIDSEVERKLAEALKKEFLREPEVKSAIRVFCSKNDNGFEALKKIFKDVENNTDYINYLNKIAANTAGAREACCDHFMLQVTKPKILHDDKEQIAEYEKFHYLDFIADFLYARGSNTEELKEIAGEYCMRFGIFLHRFFLSDIGPSTKEELSERLKEWKDHNEKILNDRKKEGRDTRRTEFKKECCDLFDSVYSQFVSEWGVHFIDNDLLCLSDFAYISDMMFEKQGDVQQEDKKEENESFRKRYECFRIFSRKYYEIQNKKSKITRSSLCFHLHAEIIEFFNRQLSLKDLSRIHKEYSNTKLELSKDAKERFRVSTFRKFHKIIKWEYKVSSYDEFLLRYRELSKRLIEDGAKFIWYRGLANSNYKLVPTLYRNIVNIKNDNSDVISERISDFQQMYLDQFMARVPESSEISNARMMGVIDWIACMQHYKAPTNLLDWSENLLIAMYFMLEPLIHLSMSKKIEKDKTIESIYSSGGVSLYLFDPLAYNIMWFKNKSSECAECDLIENIYLPERMPLPNLSMTHTANQFAAYVLGDSKLKRCESGCKYNDCLIQNPIAILTGQSNTRLRTQAGTFLAFSLYRKTHELDRANAPTDSLRENNLDETSLKSVEGWLDESSLEHLQDEWLDSGNTGKPFLYKITVSDKKTLEELTNWTIRAGMSTYKVYPDLQNIGLFVANTTRS